MLVGDSFCRFGFNLAYLFMYIGLNNKQLNNMKKKIVYIAHPIGGDIEANLKSIQEIYAVISRTRPDVIPFCPYYATVMSLDDSVSGDRLLGMEHNKAFFEHGVIKEMWWFNRVSDGIAQEIDWCEEFYIPYYAKVLHGGIIV